MPKHNTYEAEGPYIFYYHPDEGTKELFLTVHPTKDTAGITPEQQAETLADLLNEHA